MDSLYRFVDSDGNRHRLWAESLYWYDQGKNIVPLLATSGNPSAENPLRWEFRLKENVRFHNLDPITGRDVFFTKFDVLATFERVVAYAPYAPIGFATMLNPIDLPATFAANPPGSDPLHLIIITKAPFRYLRNNLAQIFIMNEFDAKKAIQIQNEAAADGRDVSAEVLKNFANGSLINGTGPFRFNRWVPHSDASSNAESMVEVTRFAGYHGQQSIWDKIQVVHVSNDEERISRLLSGDLDLIDNVPGSALSALEGNASVRIAKAASLRTMFLSLYLGNDGRESNSLFVPFQDIGGNAMPNPLRSRKFREALFYGMDRAELVKVMEGLALPTSQFMQMGKAGYFSDIPDNSYDLVKARRLFIEASREPGMEFLKAPGSTLTFHGPKGRFAHDDRVSERAAELWSEAFGDFVDAEGIHYSMNIKAVVEPQVIYMKGVKLRMAGIVGGGLDTGDLSAPSRLYYGTNAALNYGAYSNLEVDRLYKEGTSNFNQAESEEILMRALRAAQDDAAVIPFFHPVEAWAMKSGFTLIPRVDGMTLANQLIPDPVFYKK